MHNQYKSRDKYNSRVSMLCNTRRRVKDRYSFGLLLQ